MLVPDRPLRGDLNTNDFTGANATGYGLACPLKGRTLRRLAGGPSAANHHGAACGLTAIARCDASH